MKNTEQQARDHFVTKVDFVTEQHFETQKPFSTKKPFSTWFCSKCNEELPRTIELNVTCPKCGFVNHKNI